MKYLLILMCSLIISGCSVLVPVKQKFPEAVPELKEKCPELKELENVTTNILDVLKIVIENYSRHYQCANKVDGWIEWYDFQKENYNNPKKK